MITDGQVHDVPADLDALRLRRAAACAAVRPARRGDRRLVVAQAPSFGLVGKPATLKLRVEDCRPRRAGSHAPASTWRKDGSPAAGHRAGRPRRAGAISIDHGGPNILELSVEPGPHELTLANNRAVVVVNGVRDRLRVLLVSGEPHAGERVWRNILKSDPSVDLVHFTILRPPEKQDGTPIHELVADRLSDPRAVRRQARRVRPDHLRPLPARGILPQAYFENVARYVEQGGALLEPPGPASAPPEPLSARRSATSCRPSRPARCSRRASSRR